MKLVVFSFAFFWIISVSLALSSIPKDYSGWALIVDITKYDAPEISITDFNDSLKDKLKAVLTEAGGFPEEQVIFFKDQKCTFNNIKLAIENLSQKLNSNSRFILYFRGCVAKPSTVRPAYLLTYDTSVKDYSKAITETLLGKWLSQIKSQDRILVMDYYTFKSDARDYTINRAIIGTSSINIFQPTDRKKDIFGEKVVEALKLSETDTDENRKISVRELYEYVTEKSGLYLSPMGNLDATFIELPSMLQIKSIPSEAYVYVNNEKFGLTPQRIDDLRSQTYEIEVIKEGYLIPEKRVVKIQKLRGQAANLTFNLIPIRIYGKVEIEPDEKLPDNIKIQIKDYVTSLDNAGNYSLDEWDEYDLEIGKKYQLVATGTDLYYGSTEFVLEGKENIHKDIKLHRRGWFDVAQIRFNRAQNSSSQQEYNNAVREAVEAFQKGVEKRPNFTEISTDFAIILYDYFKQATELVPDNLNYIIATAKLAEQLELKNEAERYWEKVKDKSSAGSFSHKLAVQHLKELSPYKGLIRVLLIILLVSILISASYLIYRYKK